MSKSLFIPYNTASEYLSDIDNLLIVKLIHDEGIAFPNRRFNGESLFHDALSVLFQSPICMEREDQYGERQVFSLRSSLIQEWTEIKRSMNDSDEWEENMQGMLEDLNENAHDYSEFECHAEITSFGLRIETVGYNAFFHPVLERFIEFKTWLDHEISKWKNEKGVLNHDGDVDHFTRGRQASEYLTAV